MIRTDKGPIHYSISWDHLLGAGINKVYEGRNTTTQKSVAIKVINADSASKQEVDAMTLCAAHPHIVQLVDSFQQGSKTMIAMERLEGGELFDRVKESPLSEGNIKQVIYQMASALDYIHSKGLIHRDIKLENCLLTCKNPSCFTVKLVDFGFAIHRSDVITAPVMYTACNCPPEMLPTIPRPRPLYDTKADMWALGVMLYAMATGIHPFQIPSSSTSITVEKRVMLRIASGSINRAVLSGLSVDCVRVLDSLLQLDPTTRPSASELLVDPWLDVVHPPCLCVKHAPIVQLAPVQSVGCLVFLHIIQNNKFARIAQVHLSDGVTYVSDLQRLIVEQEHIAVEAQQLVFKGQLLKADQPLQSMGIHNGSTVFLPIRNIQQSQ